MGKILNIPAWSNYSAGIQSVGDKSNATATSMEVSNVSLDAINKEMGTSFRTVHEALTTDLINKYALFKPNPNAPHSLMEFAGYNHHAIPPTNFGTVRSSFTDTWNENNNQYSINIPTTMRRGEIQPEFPKSWDRVMVIITFRDELNNYVTTLYSGYKKLNLENNEPYVCTFNSENIERRGVMSIDAVYISQENGSLIPIEDLHSDIPFRINVKYFYIYKSQMIYKYNPTYATRAYYRHKTNSTAPLKYLDINIGCNNDLINPDFVIDRNGDIPEILPSDSNYIFANSIWSLLNANGYIRYKVNKIPVQSHFTFDSKKYRNPDCDLFRVTGANIYSSWPPNLTYL